MRDPALTLDAAGRVQRIVEGASQDVQDRFRVECVRLGPGRLRLEVEKMVHAGVEPEPWQAAIVGDLLAREDSWPVA